MVINVFYFVDTEKWLNVKPKLEKYNPLETKKKNPVAIFPHPFGVLLARERNLFPIM